MKKQWRLLVIALFFAFLFLPLLQQVTGLLAIKALGGEEEEVKRPIFRFDEWFDRKWQQEFETWNDLHIGMRPWMIRTANQINLSLFGRINQSKGTRVCIGQKDVLFEEVYVTEYTNPRFYNEEYLRSYTWGVFRLQQLLELHGVPFLLIIAPSKAEIYPEYLPQHSDSEGREEKVSAYQQIRPLLDKYQINYLDGHELFRKWKEEGAPWLFARGGTHWNYYGAGKIIHLALDNIAKQRGKDFDNVEVTSYTTDSEPHGTDNDLEMVLNRWFSGGTNQEQIHPKFVRHERGNLPRLMMIGDSFAHTLITILEEQHLFENCELLYYSKRRFSWPASTNSPIDMSQLDFQKEMLDKDAVIMEISENNLPKFGFGALRAAVTDLEAADPVKI
ncbi:MAG: hypothetical protein KJ804_00515 [Proteobacteria bacterium]|nr:hypothetical protein [Pseudomonadota bacterium]MBU1056789.1 hypothetical protein [Pseudomonadota bacterium]